MCAAQAAVLTGKELAATYVHAGMIGLDGEKMSKSKGNLIFVSRLVAAGVDPMAIRWALMSDHYRTDRMWGDDLLLLSQKEIGQLQTALNKNVVAPTTDLIQEIIQALSNDLDTPAVVKALNSWSLLTMEGSEGGDASELRQALDALLGLLL
jgi:L-cysteine:1D-myo-inositol 2-amino-2-deoxy-alpha-D-glucopyranoside ligase